MTVGTFTPDRTPDSSPVGGEIHDGRPDDALLLGTGGTGPDGWAGGSRGQPGSLHSSCRENLGQQPALPAHGPRLPHRVALYAAGLSPGHGHGVDGDDAMRAMRPSGRHRGRRGGEGFLVELATRSSVRSRQVHGRPEGHGHLPPSWLPLAIFRGQGRFDDGAGVRSEGGGGL